MFQIQFIEENIMVEKNELKIDRLDIVLHKECPKRPKGYFKYKSNKWICNRCGKEILFSEWKELKNVS